MLDYFWNICQVTEVRRPLLIIHDAVGHQKYQPLKLNNVLTSSPIFGSTDQSLTKWPEHRR